MIQYSSTFRSIIKLFGHVVIISLFSIIVGLLALFIAAGLREVHYLIIVVIAGIVEFIGLIFILKKYKYKWIVGLAMGVILGFAIGNSVSVWPPTFAELTQATSLVHDSPLEADKEPHSVGYKTDPFNIDLLSHGTRVEQSDFKASVEEATADIENRLKNQGYEVITVRGQGQFINIEENVDNSIIIRAHRKNLNLTVYITSTENGSIVASYVE